MSEKEKREGECTCHISPPCWWCVSLTEEEVDVFYSGGRGELLKYWRELDDEKALKGTK